jgi:hypothetical protein
MAPMGDAEAPYFLLLNTIEPKPNNKIVAGSGIVYIKCLPFLRIF